MTMAPSNQIGLKQTSEQSNERLKFRRPICANQARAYRFSSKLKQTQRMQLAPPSHRYWWKAAIEASKLYSDISLDMRIDRLSST